MTPKLRVVLEKLTREHPMDVLAELLSFEAAVSNQDHRRCCQAKWPDHHEECRLDKLLKRIGLATTEVRADLRAEALGAPVESEPKGK